MPLGNTIWLWAFLSLIPLIILYLRRPKPVDRIFPSLMFLMRERGSIRKYSFFRDLIRNILFFLQLLALAILAFSLTSPYLSYTGTVLGQHNVIVIDASASSQTKVQDTTRFEKEVEEASDYINGKTSVILAGTTAQVALENGKKSDALDVLNSIKPTDTLSNLEHAMRTAESLIGDKKGKVIVISDFKITSGQDPVVLKRILASKDIPVDFIDVGDTASNIGIIDMVVSKHQTKVYVKNFNEKDEPVIVRLVQGSIVDEKPKTIRQNSVEVFTFPTLQGVSEIRLDVNDDFDRDDFVFISSPVKTKIKTMLVTNSEYEGGVQSYLKNALEASPDIELDTAEPPIIPSLEGYDVIIVSGVFSDRLLPSFFRDVKTVVKNGTDFVVVAYENIGNINFRGLMPVEIGGISEQSGGVELKVVNRFTKDTDFSLIKVDRYFKTETGNTTAVIASVNESPVIALQDFGEGNIVFYGIMDKYSEFKLSPDYPIFWNNFLNFLANLEGIENYNIKLEDKPFLEKAGLYEEKNRKIAVNLLNEQESDVSKRESASMREEDSSEMGKEENRIYLTLPILVLASLIILLELLYVKKRGDL